MKFKVSKEGLVICITFSVLAVISMIALINYIESLFLVLIGWILIPIFVVKIYRWLNELIK